MKKRSLKQQLLLSVTALLLCVSMFVGSTFAWFTDSVTSTNNIIKSGNLDVSLEWLEGVKNPTTAADGDWKNAASGPIFTDKELWEPGYTAVRHIKIENEGSLALKYMLTITAYDNGNVVAPEDVSILADVIDVYYVDPAKAVTRDTVETLDKLGSLREVLAGLDTTAKGTLLKGEKDTVTLALKMREDANNDYQNKSIGQNFSITLFATQLEYEDDSFDNTYDEDALYGKTVEVNNKADLMTVLANATADEPINVILASDVEYPTEGTHGLKDITPASAITIDGKGQYKLIATGSGVTPVGDSVAPLTLKNLTVVDNSVSYAEDSWEFTYLEFAGDLTFDNVVFEGGISVDGDETNAVFNNCTFKTAEDSVYAAWVSAGTVAFNDCTFTGTRGLKVHEDYGTNVNTVLVDGCKFDSITKKPGIAIGDIYQSGTVYVSGGSSHTDESNTVITVKNSTFIDCQAGDQGKYIYETDTTEGAWLVMENNNLGTKVASATEFTDAIAAGKAVKLTDDVTVDTITIPASSKADIDLNGNELTVKKLEAVSGAEVTVEGGTIIHDKATYPAVSVNDGGKLVLNDVNIVCNEPCNLMTSGVNEAAEYVGLQVFGGVCELNNCTIEVNVDKIRYMNSAYGIAVHDGELVMNGGSVKVTSPGSNSEAMDYQAAFAGWQTGDKKITLNGVTIDAKNYLDAGKGHTVVNTTDSEGSWDGKVVTSGGTYTVNYVK